jgi:hypothetical protein
MNKVNFWILSIFLIVFLSGNVIAAALEGGTLSVSIPENHEKVQAGEMLQFKLEIENIQKAGRHDIQLDYYIKKNDIVINHRRELKAVETQASFLSSIKVPEETLPGIYDIEVGIDDEILGMDTFYVKSSDERSTLTYLKIIAFSIIIIGAVVIWELYRLSAKRK